MIRQKTPEDRILEILKKAKLSGEDWKEIIKEREER